MACMNNTVPEAWASNSGPERLELWFCMSVNLVCCMWGAFLIWLERRFISASSQVCGSYVARLICDSIMRSMQNFQLDSIDLRFLHDFVSLSSTPVTGSLPRSRLDGHLVDHRRLAARLSRLWLDLSAHRQRLASGRRRVAINQLPDRSDHQSLWRYDLLLHRYSASS